MFQPREIVILFKVTVHLIWIPVDGVIAPFPSCNMNKTLKVT